jgi:competence protein ComEA
LEFERGMADSLDQSTTVSNAETFSIVTAPADVPTEPCTSPVESDLEAHPVASTLDGPPDATPGPPASDAIWGLRPGDRLLLLVLGAVCFALSVWHWGRLSGWGMDPVEVDRLPERIYDYRIDLNRATWVELMQLPGVGETLAQRILEHRDEHGPFQSVDDLDTVKGIGPKTLEKLRPLLFVEEPLPP